LIVSKHLSKNPKHYKQHVSQVIAAEQLMKERDEVNAGKNVHFLFTDSDNKRFDRRVKLNLSSTLDIEKKLTESPILRKK
jgi:DNA polymerase elongation subunit (family B)